MMRSLTIMIAAAITFGGMAITPAAARPLETTSVRVSYADLDIRHDPGARVLLGRIEHAAQIACGARSGPMPLSERRAQRACVRADTRQAVATVGSPALWAEFNGHQTFVSMLN